MEVEKKWRIWSTKAKSKNLQVNGRYATVVKNDVVSFDKANFIHDPLTDSLGEVVHYFISAAIEMEVQELLAQYEGQTSPKRQQRTQI